MITDVKDEILRSLENASTPEKRAFDKKLIDTEKESSALKPRLRTVLSQHP